MSIRPYLYEDDADRKVNYCDWLLHDNNEDHNLVSFIFLYDPSIMACSIDRIPDIRINKINIS
jgi:hypothetical protein